MKILFIENHAVFAKTVTSSFLKNYSVDIVPSIKQAEEKLSLAHYDIALVDYDLDDGKGDQITTKINTLYPETKIIAVSSHSKGNNLILNAGADAICGKMEFQKINNAIASIL